MARSSCASSSRQTTSATSSRPSCVTRRSACVPRPLTDGRGPSSATHRTIDAIWRIESAKLIAGLARMVRDVGLAEDSAQDALVAALEQWPQSGVPANPGAWLMITAKHRAIDRLRRNDRLAAKVAELGHEARESDRVAVMDGLADFDAVIDDDELSDD